MIVPLLRSGAKGRDDKNEREKAAHDIVMADWTRKLFPYLSSIGASVSSRPQLNRRLTHAFHKRRFCRVTVALADQQVKVAGATGRSWHDPDPPSRLQSDRYRTVNGP
jgi:hypothetical protein